MGMSMHVMGFRPPNEKWKKMKAIWDSCTAADLSPPKEVLDFFDHEEPNAAGVTVVLENCHCCSPWSENSREGFEIDVSKLPKDVTIIRFYNAY